MKAKEEKKREKTIILTIMLLIALFIIIFLLINSFGKIDNNVQVPTGNVNIFDIVLGNVISNNDKCNYNCTCNCQKNNNTTNDNNNVEMGKNNYKPGCPDCENNSENTMGDKSGMTVYDNEKEYAQSTPLNIFTQTSYHVLNGVIAPASENSYQFVIRNHNKFNIKYSLEFIEENKYNINMKFKLKINGTYVIGDNNTYVTANELNQYDVVLASNSYNVYTLEWKWFENDNDTEIGTNINANYKLNLKISANQY